MFRFLSQLYIVLLFFIWRFLEVGCLKDPVEYDNTLRTS